MMRLKVKWAPVQAVLIVFKSLSSNIKWNMSYYSPIPCFESIASSLEEVAFHHHSIWGINVKLHL